MSVLLETNDPIRIRTLKFRLSWGHIGAVIVAVAGTFWGVSTMMNESIRDSLLRIDTSISRIDVTLKSQGESIVRVEENLKYLNLRVEKLERPGLEAKARAAGFKSPQIITTNLQLQIKFRSKVEWRAQTFFLQYTILNYDQVNELMTLEVNEVAPGNNIGRSNTFEVYAKPGQPVVIPHFYPGVPKIYMEVLDLPSPDRAIIAIGERVGPRDKHS